MLALKIFMIFLLVALAGFFVSFLWWLLLGPLVFKGIFKADLDDINEKRKNETRFSNNPRIEKLVRAKRRRNSCR